MMIFLSVEFVELEFVVVAEGIGMARNLCD